MTKIDRHFLLLYGVICFTLYMQDIARNRLSYFVACKCVIYFRVPYLFQTQFQPKNEIDFIAVRRRDIDPEAGPDPLAEIHRGLDQLWVPEVVLRGRKHHPVGSDDGPPVRGHL